MTFAAPRVAAVVALTLLFPSRTALHAQVSTSARISNLAANAAIGAALGAVRSLLSHRPVTRPVLLGAAGGVLEGAGRQIAAGRSTAAGLVGREVSALGISLGYSAASDSLVLIAPVWLISFEIRPRGEGGVHARVNLVDVALVTSALIQGHSLDLGSTLSAGAPVFSRARPLHCDVAADCCVDGYSRVGVIYLMDDIPPDRRRLALRHETVHLLQWDTYNQLAAFPLERSILHRLTRRAFPPRFLDLGVLGPAAAYLVAEQIPYDQQPWEREAYMLTTGRPTAQ